MNAIQEAFEQMNHTPTTDENQIKPELRFTSFENKDRKPLGKKIEYDPDLKHLFSKVLAQMVQGKGVNAFVNGIEDFGKFLTRNQGQTSHAVAYGLLPTDDVTPIASKDFIASGRAVDGAVTRSNATLAYAEGEPGIFPIDFDIKEPIDHVKLDGIICSVMPEIADTKRIYTPSSSSKLYYESELVSVKSGWRVHFAVDDASRMPAIGNELFARLIDAGEGWVEFGANGSRLLRSYVDRSMYQPSRLDFVHGGVRSKGLEWRHTVLTLDGAELLHTAAIECRDFKEWQRQSPEVARLMGEAQPASAKKYEAWRGPQIEKLVAKGVSAEQATRVYAKAAPDLSENPYGPYEFMCELEGAFPLHRHDGTTFTVDEALDDPDTYHGMTVLDPMEPDYPSGECAMLFIKDQHAYPVLFSRAHGDMSYKLCRTGEGDDDEPSELHKSLNRIESSGPGATEFIVMPADEKKRLNGLLEDLGKCGRKLLYDIDVKSLNAFVWEALEASNARGLRWTWDDAEFVLSRTKALVNNLPDIFSAVSDTIARYERREQQKQENRELATATAATLRIQAETLTGDEADANLVFILSGTRVGDIRDKSVFKLTERIHQFSASQTLVRGKDGSESVMPTTHVWQGSGQRKQAFGVTWRPGAPEFCHAPDGGASGGVTDSFNTWRGLPVYTPPDEWENNVAVWDEHVDYLIPDRRMHERFIQWLAHMVQKPGELPSTAFCMIAETHGIGRNWMASVLTRVLQGYVRPSLSLDQMFEKSFNGTLSQKLLAVVDEVHERQARDRYKVANRLRQLITAEFSEINAKYGGNWIEYNCLRWLFFSNYLDALPVGDNDRRIEFVQNPRLCQSPAYYTRLFAALKDPHFIASVRHRLQTLDISGFNPGQHAAKTEFRAAAIDASEGALEAAIKDYMEEWPGDHTTLRHLGNYVKHAAGQDKFDDGLVARVARQFGLHSTKIRIRPDGKTGKRDTVMFNGARTTEAHVKASDPARITARFKEWRDAFARDVYGQDEVDL